MAKGGQDWTNVVTLYGVAPDGTHTPVRINAAGRLEAVILGALEGITDNITVDQEDSIRQVQGIEGANLRTVAVDASGQIIMVPRGQSGHYLDVDASGFMSAILKGTEGENIRSVAVNASGQIVAVIQGAISAITDNVTVVQDGSIREMQGVEGANLRTVAVDASGQIIMVPRGSTGNYVAVDAAGNMSSIMQGLDGATLRTVAVNASGQLVAVIQGAITGITNDVTVLQDDSIRQIQGIEGANLRTVAVDASGQIIMVPRGSTGNYVAVDASGYMSTIMKGIEGANLRTIAVNASGQLISVMQGDYEGTLKTVSLDADGRMETVVKGTKDVTRGLRLWYKFNSVEGVNIRDSSPWSNNGIGYHGLTETVVYDDGVVGQAIKSDGAGDCVEIPANDSLLFTNEATIECWLSFDSLPAPVGIEEYFIDGGSSRLSGRVAKNTSTLRIKSARAGGDGECTHTLSTSYVWYHVIYTTKAGEQKLYVDADLKDSATAAGALEAIAGNLILLAWTKNSGHCMAGRMEEFRLYSVVLTQDEVTTRYNLTKLGGTGSLQEIAVNTRGQIEVQARDANAIIRNLLVDSAGRLIIVPRGESGYYLDVDSDGYMTSVMKGIEGANLRTLAVNAAGQIVAVIQGNLAGIDANVTVDQQQSIREMQGVEGVTLHTVAVDSSGQIIMVPRGQSGNYLDVTADGFMTTILKGTEGANIRSVAVNAAGQIVAVLQGNIAGIDGNITVDQSGSTRQVQGIEGANLRTLSVDSSGRLITIIRGASGYNVLVDASGFMSSIMKGHDGSAYRNIRTDTSGRMEALMKGTYNATLKTVAVDTDGRMEAIIKRLPYEDVVMERTEDNYGATEIITVESPACPANYMWCLGSVSVYSTHRADAVWTISIKHGANAYTIYQATPPAAYNSVVVQGPFYLATGDFMRINATKGYNGAAISISVNGYRQPV